MIETSALVWNKPGDLSDWLEIRPYSESNLNGNRPCPKCSLPLELHGVYYHGGTIAQEPRIICPGEQFQEGIHPREGKPVKNEGDAIVEMAKASSLAGNIADGAELPTSVRRMRTSLDALYSKIASVSPEFMSGASSTSENVNPPEAVETAASVFENKQVTLPSTLPPQWIEVLAGVHPNQPIVYEVEPALTGAGYQITKYQNAPERARIDSFACGDMPRYQVEELRLKLQIQLGYNTIVKKFGGTNV